MSVIIDTTKSELEAVIRYARYGANNCMIGNGWEIKELVRCKDCKNYNAGFECLIEGYGIERDKDWFCADAERREDGRK